MMQGFFEWAILVMSVCVIICTMKKYWWAPIVGLVQEIPWAGYAIYAKSLPIFIVTVLYALVFAFSIRKWYREKKNSKPWCKTKFIGADRDWWGPDIHQH